ARPLHQRFHAEQNITHFYVHDTDRVNFLRVHKPDRYGDVIDRFTMMKTAKTAEPASGIELGPLGTLTLRAVHPWRIDGRLIGYIELGMGVDHLVKELRESLGIDVMLLVDKRFLNRRDWVAGMRMLGRKADWEQFADSVVANRTIEHVPPEMTKWLNQAHRDQTKGHFEVTIEGRRHSVGSLRLRDVSGREIGDIVVFHDATAQYAALRRFIGFLAAVCADAGIGLFVLFYVILGRAQRSLQAAHAKALEESHARQEQQEHHYAEAQRKQEFLENMVESLTHPFCVIDANDYTVKLANSAILGDRPLGHQTCYALTHKGDKPCKGEHTCPLEEVKRTKKPVTVEHVHYDRDGNALDVEVHGYPIFDSEGNVVQMIEYCLDITQRKRAEQAVADKSRQLEKANRLLAKQAKYDELTHILNRRGFYEVLSAEAERVHRYASPLAIVMCDIDHFKRINDLYGHDFGDVVLREVASILDSESRNVDTTARYGGDEFMIVLPSTSCDKAYQVAERIRARLAEATITDGKHEVQITASFGVAGIEAGEDAAAAELPRLADEALYAAKRAGRNRTVNRRDTTDGHTSPHVKAGAGKVG
ncbi:MAG: diguanylate cyclase, partial [Planctomycetia bacterium]|nr:diguanylate cyclase [Planctomycetia bacterium]